MHVYLFHRMTQDQTTRCHNPLPPGKQDGENNQQQLSGFETRINTFVSCG